MAIKYRTDRANSLPARAVAVAAQKLAGTLQNFPPEVAVGALALTLKTISIQEDLDLADVMSAAQRRFEDLRNHSPEQMRALEDFLRWQMRAYSTD